MGLGNFLRECEDESSESSKNADGNLGNLQPAKGNDGEENVYAPSEKKAPWVNLFKDNRKLDKNLSLKLFDNFPEQIHLSYDIIDNVETAWGYCLVGYFAGQFPVKKALLNLCDSWRVNFKYFTHSSGWLVFKFENDSDRESVLNGGP
ncbi:DUF4283 domain-containing protein [Abeliophyllum distichum]|uniref:DUF4283 domain-containing protein n=1 Tax=Abeliophyllum distichum TaxID=126358 RepID=A0ABD1RGE1_9LAMI